jgi:bifunctional UDP-N-acetylglucosamine pyrophosphorylase/glucosamine-1-phosphate N-acetyltransferase
VPADAIAIGRAKQVNRLGLATIFFDKLRAVKSAKKGQ